MTKVSALLRKRPNAAKGYPPREPRENPRAGSAGPPDASSPGRPHYKSAHKMISAGRRSGRVRFGRFLR